MGTEAYAVEYASVGEIADAVVDLGYSENRVEFEGCTATRREHESQT